MTEEQMLNICSANDTNLFIYASLDKETRKLCEDMLLKLDANDFKEINPDAVFDFTWLPIPYDKLEKSTQDNQITYGSNVQQEFKNLFKNINKKGTNREYPYVFYDQKEGKEENEIHKMANGDSEKCDYDWEWIRNFVKEHKGTNMTLFHTHPNPLGKQQKTLFNKYSEELREFGVKPNGLNLSLSDIYAQMYLEMIISANNPNLTSQSLVLMHTGELVAFSTKNGVKLEHYKKLEQNKNTQDEFIK